MAPPTQRAPSWRSPMMIAHPLQAGSRVWRHALSHVQIARLAAGRSTSLRITRYSTVSQLVVEYLYARWNSDPDHTTFFTSNNLALPAKSFHAVGGFDAGWTRAAGEDRDLCDRLIIRGYRLMYARRRAGSPRSSPYISNILAATLQLRPRRFSSSSVTCPARGERHPLRAARVLSQDAWLSICSNTRQESSVAGSVARGRAGRPMQPGGLWPFWII